jgi:hypothetical protein
MLYLANHIKAWLKIRVSVGLNIFKSIIYWLWTVLY